MARQERILAVALEMNHGIRKEPRSRLPSSTRLLSPLLCPIGRVSNLANLFASGDRPSTKTGAHRVFPAS